MPRPYLIIDGEVHRTLRGRDASRIRAQVRREQEAALARYDAEPTAKNRSAILSHEGVEDEVGRRLEEEREGVAA